MLSLAAPALVALIAVGPPDAPARADDAPTGKPAAAAPASPATDPVEARDRTPRRTARDRPGRATAREAPPDGAAAPADEKPRAARAVVISAARINVGTGEVHAPGQILIEDGVVKAIGDKVKAPENAERWDFPSGEITPWLVDPLVAVSLGRGEGGRADASLLSAADAAPTHDPWLGELRARGLGAFMVVPSGASGVLGRTATVSTKAAPAGGAEILGDPVALAHAVPEGVGGSAARAAARATLPQMLEDAEQWNEQRTKSAEKSSRKKGGVASVGRDKPGGVAAAGERRDPQPQPAQEFMLTVAQKKVPLLVTASREADASAMLALARSRGLTVTLAGCRDCAGLASELASSRAIVILDPLHAPAGRVNGIEANPDLPGILDRAGARLAVTGGGSWPAGPQMLRAAAASLVGAGASRDTAIAAMTGVAAESAGIADRGAIATGKPARLLVWSGDPLEPGSRIERSLEPEDLKPAREKASDEAAGETSGSDAPQQETP